MKLEAFTALENILYQKNILKCPQSLIISLQSQAFVLKYNVNYT